MTITLIVIVLMLALFLGWVLSHSFNVRPWVAAAPSAATLDRLPAFFTPSRVGLIVFLAAISSLFALTLSAYSGRMHMSHDWVSVPKPLLLWVNTALLALSSFTLHAAWRAATRDQRRKLNQWLMVSGILTLAFIAGQYLAWQQLHAQGHYLAANPAASFFYLVTALHAVHVLGGMIAWARTLRRVWGGYQPSQLRTGVELCAVYWHYLLFVWVVLFVLLQLT